MRSDYALYAVAVIFFIMTGIVLAYSYFAYVIEFRELWILTTAVLGLAFIGIGYSQRPRQATISAPSHTVASSTTLKAKPSIAESIVTKTIKAEKTDMVAEADVSTEGLSRIKGIGKKRAEQLRTLGIVSVEELAKARPRQLAGKLDVSTKTTKKWIQNAKEIIERS
jgi:predicted flap endonuclease-1-like 5' DNA nuclease